MSNNDIKSLSKATAKHQEFLFDKVGSNLSLKPAKDSKINTDELFYSPNLTCNLICKNLKTSEIIQGTFSLHKNFLIFFGVSIN